MHLSTSSEKNRPLQLSYFHDPKAILFTSIYSNSISVLKTSYEIIGVIKSRMKRWAGHVALMGKKRNAYRDFVGKCEGNRPQRRPRPELGDNIKMF
jgi:hypothetical protein